MVGEVSAVRRSRGRRRGRWLCAAAAVAAALAAGAWAWSLNVEGARMDGYEITWLGDTFLGDRAEDMLAQHGYGWAFERSPQFASSDLTVINAEAPLTTRQFLPDAAVSYSEGSPIPRYRVFTSRGEVTRYIHRGSPEAAVEFARFGVDVAILGNNHAMDQGSEGLADTLLALEAAGIASIGAGLDADRAAEPVIIDTDFGRIGIFSFGERGGTAPDATPETAGIRALNTANVDAAQEIARQSGVDWLVATVHWGSNYGDVVPAQERWAERLTARGWDLIVGHGSHTAQRIELVNDTPVIYSLGNFAFQSRGRYTPEAPGFGLAVSTVLGPRGFNELRVTCMQTDNLIVDYQVRECSDADAHTVLEGVWPGIEVAGPIGTITW